MTASDSHCKGFINGLIIEDFNPLQPTVAIWVQL